MSNDANSPNKASPHAAVEPATSPLRSVLEQRRRMLKGGLSGGAVVAALVSRQALAGAVCTTASGFTSLSASGPRTSQYTCSGYSPTYWAQQSTAWPGAYTKGNFNSGQGTYIDNTGTSFNQTFGGSKFPAAMSMANVIRQVGSGDPYRIGGYVVAAALNLASGRVNVMDFTRLKAIWMSYVNTGSYVPTAGVTWTPGQIVEYLQSTMT